MLVASLQVPHCLGPMLVGTIQTPELPSPSGLAMAYTAAFVASNAACVMACVIAAFSVTLLSYFLACLYLLVFAETAFVMIVNLDAHKSVLTVYY